MTVCHRPRSDRSRYPPLADRFLTRHYGLPVSGTLELGRRIDPTIARTPLCPRRDLSSSAVLTGLDLIGARHRLKGGPSAPLQPARRYRLITLGVDAHKAIHVAVAVDESGRELANGVDLTRPMLGRPLTAGRQDSVPTADGESKAPGATDAA